MSTYTLNKNSFSRLIGLSNNVTIGRIINENRHPSQKVLQLILTIFSNINANWLVSGMGEMYKNPFDRDAENILLNKISKLDNSKTMAGKMAGKMAAKSEIVAGKTAGIEDDNEEDDFTAYKTISTQIVNLLFKENKELNQEVGALKQENAVLRAENAKLKRVSKNYK